MKTLKIPFNELVGIALERLEKEYPEINVEKYTFMKGFGKFYACSTFPGGHEPDSEAYELPDYLEIELKEKEIQI